MASLRCRCGHVIRDQADNLPYKGRIVRDQDQDRFLGEVSHDIAEFVTALVEGTAQPWLANHFFATDAYPGETGPEGVIHDLLAGAFLLSYSLTTYQCEQCGRVWIQEQPGSPAFRSFAPDHEWKDTFAVRARD